MQLQQGPSSTSPSLVGPGLDGMYAPLPSFPLWTQVMSRAEQALRGGCVREAESLYSEALALVEQSMARLDPKEARVCLTALVSSSACLSELLSEQARPQQAAATLAHAHERLIQLMIRHPRCSDWHQAAAWHIRQTHDWLVRHWEAHGPDPLIEQAFRAACVLLNSSKPALH